MVGILSIPATACDQNSRAPEGGRGETRQHKKQCVSAYCTSCWFEALMASGSRRENSRVHADGRGGLDLDKDPSRIRGQRIRPEARASAAARCRQTGGMLQDTQNTVTHAELTPPSSPIPVYSQWPTSMSDAHSAQLAWTSDSTRLRLHTFGLCVASALAMAPPLRSLFSARARGEAPKLALPNHIQGRAKTLPLHAGFAPPQTPPRPSPRSTPAWARPAHAHSLRHTRQGPPPAARL